MPPPGVALTPNSIVALLGGDIELKPLVEVLDVKQIGSGQSSQERFRLVLSDGSSQQQAMLATQLNELVKKNEVVQGTIVRLLEYICNTVQNRKIIIVLNMEVVHQGQVQNASSASTFQAPTRASEPPPQSTAPSPFSSGATFQAPAPHSYTPQQTEPPQQQSSPFVTNRAPESPYGRPMMPPQNAGSAVPSPFRGPGSSMPQQQYGKPIVSPQQPTPSYSNRGPIARNEAPAQIVPIAVLNPYQSRWTVKARITAKSDLRKYSNAKGEGKVFSFDLLDGEGGEIRITCFNAVAEQFYERAEVGRTYLVSKGQIKGAQKNFNHLRNEWEITFDRDSILEPCQEDSSIPQQSYAFRPISDIENVESNSTVDILGVVVGVNQTTTIMRKNGTETQKRSIQLKDMSGKSVELTMWGNFCTREGQQLQELFDSGQHPILVVKSGRVTDFSGKTVGTLSSTQLQINPGLPEANALRLWYDREGKHATAQSISMEGAGSSRETARKTVAQIKDENLGRSDKPDWITLKATIHFIKTDNFCYTACPSMIGGRQCNKKVINNGDGTWRCDRCDKSVPECDFRYLLSLQVMDHTGSTWLTGFQEPSEELLGVSAKELFAWKQSEIKEEHSKFLDCISNLQFTQHLFKLRIKEENYNDEQRVKATIQKTEKVDFVAESKVLLDWIGKLERGEPISVPSVPASSSFGGGYSGGIGAGGFGAGGSATNTGGYGSTAGGGFGSSFGGTTSAGGSGGGGSTNCFKCGQAGHWAKDCPNSNQGSSYGAGGGGGYNSSAGGYGNNAGGGYGSNAGGYGSSGGVFGGTSGGYGGGSGSYSGGGGGGAAGGGGGGGGNACFKCGQGGHWARDCPNANQSSGPRNTGYGGGGRWGGSGGF